MASAHHACEHLSFVLQALAFEGLKLAVGFRKFKDAQLRSAIGCSLHQSLRRTVAAWRALVAEQVAIEQKITHFIKRQMSLRIEQNFSAWKAWRFAQENKRSAVFTMICNIGCALLAAQFTTILQHVTPLSLASAVFLAA